MEQPLKPMSTGTFYPVLLRRTDGVLDRIVVNQDCSTKEEAAQAAKGLCKETDLPATTLKSKLEHALKSKMKGVSFVEVGDL